MKYHRCKESGHLMTLEQCVHRLRDEHGIFTDCPSRECRAMQRLTPKEPGKPFRVIKPSGENNRFKHLDKALKVAGPGDAVDVIIDGSWRSIMHITQDGGIVVGPVGKE